MHNEITIGSLDNPLFYFEDDNIIEIDTVQSVALVGQEMRIDTFSPVVSDKYVNVTSAELFRSDDDDVIETADGSIYAISIDPSDGVSDLIYLEFGTPVWYHQDGALIGKFYIDDVKRQAKNAYQLNCVSAIGLLDKLYDAGGLFLETTFGDILGRLVCSGLHGDGTQIIGYGITDEVANLPATCYLPYDTKRNNLYQIMFANGVNIVQNPHGNPEFTFLYSDSVYAQEIPEEIIYNEGAVEYQKPYELINVLEHTYTEVLTENRVTLYDNTRSMPVVGEEVFFTTAPIIKDTITATGLDILDATETSAIVSGQGVLTGIPYLHTTHLMSLGNLQADESKTISVSNCTAVNTLNSSNLLQRLYAFYCPHETVNGESVPKSFIKKITNGIVYQRLMRGNLETNPPKCGKTYKLLNPFKEPETAFLSEMNITASAVNKAQCEWYVGYEPAGQAGLYHNVVILDKETYYNDGGTWILPTGVTQIKVIMISGGQGGSSGWPGENGKDATTYTDVEIGADVSTMWYGAEGGDGGAGGPGGSPGKVKVVTITNPNSVYTYAIGDGGEGGAASGFIPDTVDSLRAALAADEPENTYTDEELEELIALEQTDWNGAPNEGELGLVTAFGEWSTNDDDSYVPTGGVYEPITNQYFALGGNSGIPGGKGGARKVENGDTFTWETDGEDVTGSDGTIYHGGSTGTPLTSCSDLPELKFTAYGGSGAGATIGIDRNTHEHINGDSDQYVEWEVVEYGS